jgi:hypothetical protein
LSVSAQKVNFLFGSKPFEHLFAHEIHVKLFQHPARNAVIHPDLTCGRAHHETGCKINAPAITGVIFAHGAPQVTGMRNVIGNAGCDREVHLRS